MYEVDFDLQISNLREEAYLSVESVGRVQVSRIVLLDGVRQLLINRLMRDRLHLDVDINHMSLCNIGPGNSDFVPNPDLYQSLQDVVLRQYRGDQWQGYYYVTPIFVPDLPWDIVLGSNHFHRLGVEWNSEIKHQFLYWLVFDSFGRYEKRAKRKLKCMNDQKDGEYYAIIIGTGFSGLGSAIKLNKLGIDNYIVIERYGHVGGTWYANKYPGCACDVPSNLYSFSFEPNPKWSHYFSRQPEIAEYLEYCTDKYNIRRHIHFNTNVTQLKWIEEQKLWQVTIQSNNQEKQLFARIIIAATGPLSSASYPTDIPGIDKFEGQMCHTSEWDKTIDFKNKRVAVIGTGASAIQVVPEIQQMNVSQLFVFQRTPPWIIPRVDRRVSNFEKRLLTYFPIIQKLIRRSLYWSREALILSFAYRWPIRYVNEELVRSNLNREIKDIELRKKVIPTWDFGCKRVLISSDWYSTLQKSNVKLITNRIKQIKSHSIITYDGDEYPVDIIIWSTGFQTQKFPLPVYGINGCSLTEQWSETIQAYRGVTVPNFPNFFILLGPNTVLGHSSVIIMIESQINYIAQAFLYMDQNNLRSIEIKEDIYEKFNKDLQLKLKRTVWQKGGCHAWYQDAKGNNTSLWPDFTWIYILLMKNFDYENYIFRT
ncbi:unnamed protein product [Rotaria sordida]|uniref:Flavin-containing monooxygenase n=2 Tax=Rotaria sordida TaxID=392033 RepID=A0A815G053_9BILA|nr:unnamed protein product [Rotaria sordida]